MAHAQPAPASWAVPATTTSDDVSVRNEAHASGVSWAAVFAGAFAVAAMLLIMFAIGGGFGLLAVSPWANAGGSSSTVSGAAIGWLIFTEIVASAIGGYLGGRLRTKWTAIHTDEVYFRDTAHGFLVWAVGLVIAAAFLTSAAAAMSGAAAGAASTTAPIATATTPAAGGQAAVTSGPDAYFVDTLFRSDRLDRRGLRAVDSRGGRPDHRIWSRARRRGLRRPNLSSRN